MRTIDTGRVADRTPASRSSRDRLPARRELTTSYTRTATVRMTSTSEIGRVTNPLRPPKVDSVCR